MTPPVMQVRPATADSLQEVLRLASFREPPLMPLRGVAAADRQRARLQRFRDRWHLLGQDPNLHVFLAAQGQRPQGFLTLVTGVSESITDEHQGVMVDFAVESDATYLEAMQALTDAASQVARSAGCEYLVTEVAAEAAAESQALEALGFMVDIIRIAKRIQPLPPAVVEGYRVRAATSSDQLFVVGLNALCGPYTLPPGRSVDPAVVADRYLNAYLRLPMSGDNATNVLIAEECATSTPIGFVITKTGMCDDVSAEALGYLYDIAVHPQHWGEQVSVLLMRSAESQLLRQGVAMLLADISAQNPRPLARAQKSLEFSIERRRWMKALARS